MAFGAPAPSMAGGGHETQRARWDVAVALHGGSMATPGQRRGVAPQPHSPWPTKASQGFGVSLNGLWGAPAPIPSNPFIASPAMDCAKSGIAATICLASDALV